MNLVGEILKPFEPRIMRIFPSSNRQIYGKFILGFNDFTRMSNLLLITVQLNNTEKFKRKKILYLIVFIKSRGTITYSTLLLHNFLLAVPVDSLHTHWYAIIPERGALCVIRARNVVRWIVRFNYILSELQHITSPELQFPYLQNGYNFSFIFKRAH